MLQRNKWLVPRKLNSAPVLTTASMPQQGLKRRFPIWAALALSLTGVVPAQAALTVVNFDDLRGLGSIPQGYGGLNYPGDFQFSHYDWGQEPYNPSSGYTRAFTFGVPEFYFPQPKKFMGAYFAGYESVSFSLYRNNVLVHTSSTLNLSRTPTFLASGYSGLVDKVRVNAPGIYWVIDDITYDLGNQPPVANPDSYSVNEDGILSVGPSGVLSNDRDADGNALTAIQVSGPQHGTLDLQPNGSFVYTPAANYNGPDSFTYKANDGTADSNTVSVSLTVNSVNDAPVAVADAASTAEDTSVTLNTKSNDTDVDGDTLRIVSVTQGSSGAVVLNADGTLTYTPAANFHGTDSFAYTISDGNGGMATATVNITVQAVNDAPEVSNQSLETDEDTALPVNITATDVDGDALTYNIVRQPAHGTLSGTAPNLVYTPNPNYNGPDSFAFTVTENGLFYGGTQHYYEFVTAPNISWQAARAGAAARSLYGLQGYLATITSAGENAFAATKLLGSGWLGGADEAAEGVWRWVTGPEAGQQFWQGRRSQDGGQAVNGAYSNWAPWQPDNAWTGEHHLHMVATPAAGPVGTWNDLRTIGETAPNWAPRGYIVEYGGLANDNSSLPTGTISLRVKPVNDAPVARNSTLSTDEDTAKNGTLLASDVDGDSDTLSYEIVTNGLKGSAAITNASTGAFTYTPNLNANGQDTFTFKVTDKSGASDTATVALTIAPVNDAPVAEDGALTTAEDTPGEGTLAAADVDGDALSYTIHEQGSKGSASINEDTGAFTYTPNKDENGTDSFTVEVSDGKGGSDTAQVSVTVTPVNDAPTANAQSVSTNEDVAKSITLSGADIDAGDTLSYAVVDQPTRGTLSGSGANLTYTPSANVHGSDSFTFKVNDGTVDSAKVTVNITINSVNDAPVVSVVPATNAGGRALPANSGFYELRVTDVDGDAADAEIFIRDSADTRNPGGFQAGPYKSGDIIKITQARGSAAGVRPMGGGVVAHINVQGDAQVAAEDPAGEWSSTVTVSLQK